jgi:hypothetical protein
MCDHALEKKTGMVLTGSETDEWFHTCMFLVFFLDLPAFGIVEHEHAMETSSGGDQLMIDVHRKSAYDTLSFFLLYTKKRYLHVCKKKKITAKCFEFC